MRRFTSALVMEGGGFTVDGEGTLITTESVVMNPNRNPGWSRAECEAALCEGTGAEKVIWLAHGLAEDRDTDGHSDNVVQFAGPGRVVVQVAPDRANPNHGPLRENAERLRRATDAQGRRLEVVEVPQLPYTELDGNRLAVPYVNFYPVERRGDRTAARRPRRGRGVRPAGGAASRARGGRRREHDARLRRRWHRMRHAARPGRRSDPGAAMRQTRRHEWPVGSPQAPPPQGRHAP